jgi:hypothetical protein
MNRAALEKRVVERLQRHAVRDPKAWLPAVGSRSSAGAPHGLADEFFGADPQHGQLDVLARALFHLANMGVIEVASFAPVKDGGLLPTRPLSQGGQTHYGLTNPRILRSKVRQFGARLAS